MLSVLIPTYHYNAFPLAAEIHRQCQAASVPFEIIVFDDASGGFAIENQKINGLSNCRFQQLPVNIGRSKIRNLLGKSASFNNLLFLDADVWPASENFIGNYSGKIQDKEVVVSGGLLYRPEKPDRQKTLRWEYGRKREAVPADVRNEKPYHRLLASNFMIAKSLFQKVPFEENLPDLRREDTLFSYHLMQAKAEVVHIDNPVFHDGLDSFESAIAKEHQSLQGLKMMLDKSLLPYDYTRISALYKTINRAGMRKIAAAAFRTTRPAMLKNLRSSNPSLKVFDLYRIGYLCSL